MAAPSAVAPCTTPRADGAFASLPTRRPHTACTVHKTTMRVQFTAAAPGSWRPAARAQRARRWRSAAQEEQPDADLEFDDEPDVSDSALALAEEEGDGDAIVDEVNGRGTKAWSRDNFLRRLIQQEEDLEELNKAKGIYKPMKPKDYYGLHHWSPDTTQQQQQAQQAQQQQQDDGSAEGSSSGAAAGPPDEGRDDEPDYEELLSQLPGLQQQLKLEAEERAGLPPRGIEPWEKPWWLPAYNEKRYMRKPEPQLTEWDLRAKMEKRKRQLAEWEAWNERRALVGQYPSLGSDWRTDVRCADTGNPTDPQYREWSHREIWDLITQGGHNADPRDVELWVRNPMEIADAPSQGGEYRPTPEEYFESLGRLIREEDEEAIVDRDAEMALLASEFSDFDDELTGGGEDYDATYNESASGSSGDDF